MRRLVDNMRSVWAFRGEELFDVETDIGLMKSIYTKLAQFDSKSAEENNRSLAAKENSEDIL